jgi:micrococcal nuclease
MKRFLILPAILGLMFMISGCSGTASENAGSSDDQAKTNIEETQKESETADQENKNLKDKDTAEVDNAENTAEQAQQKTDSKEGLADSLGLEAVKVTRVVDGDTVEIADGRKVRLIGINTPESTTRHEEYGKEASNFTKDQLTGKTIWIQKDVSETDRYGRLLRIVWLDVPTDDMNEEEIRKKMFNAQLVLNGYAEPSTYPPDVKYSDYFVKFAQEARKNNTGLWAYGENGTTKGDLDKKAAAQKPADPTSSSSNVTQEKNSGTAANSSGSSNTNQQTDSHTAPSSSQPEYYKNCTELRKVYPNGVPADHPAYQAKMDRDKDNYACER